MAILHYNSSTTNGLRVSQSTGYDGAITWKKKLAWRPCEFRYR